MVIPFNLLLGRKKEILLFIFIRFYGFRCILNEFLFTKILCNGNETNRYIVCCSDKHYCNDRDAYSSDIRKQLSLLSNLERN